MLKITNISQKISLKSGLKTEYFNHIVTYSTMLFLKCYVKFKTNRRCDGEGSDRAEHDTSGGPAL